MTVPTTWSARVAARREETEAAGQWRAVRALDGPGPAHVLDDGRQVVSFASNDYLGLNAHPAVRAAAVDAVGRWGTGAGASRLICGDRPPHRALEAALARWKDQEAALVFPTGFAANLGVLSTFATAGVLVVSDELNHASIIDGCRLARANGATLAVARHRDAGHVAELLAAHDGPALVVSDAVFSMDGDLAPVSDLVAACRDRDALLVLDEAHAVLGPHLRSVDLEGVDVLRVGTLSKTLASLGGFVAGPRPFVEMLVNQARSFIFTTAPTPADAAAALAALAVVCSVEGDALVDRLRRHLERVAPGHPSPIVPVLVGSEEAALAAAAALLDDHRLLIPAIRPPTVPPGTSRLRVALSAAHTDEQVDRLVDGLRHLRTSSASADGGVQRALPADGASTSSPVGDGGAAQLHRTD
ncbi:MAG: aminotransferase class I/II-fold pyridoxal phosphate-dependent enzyme [Acidimicrobiia bacterium]